MVRLPPPMSGVTATNRGRRTATTVGLTGLRAWLNNDQRRVARRVSIALEQALSQQRWSRAERLATAADRLVISHSRVAESLARLRLAQDRPQAALAVVEACRSRTASLRTRLPSLTWNLDFEPSSAMTLTSI